MKKIIFLVLALTQFFLVAQAVEPFIVKDIRVEGLQRVSPGTVFNYLPVKVGDQLDDAVAQEAIRTLYKTGFFKEVDLERQGSVLIVSVLERPSVASIEIAGNREFDDEILKKGMKEAGLAEGRVFNRSMLERVEQELRNQYFSLGKYAVKLKSTVTPLERNRIGITIDIEEGDTARIKEINIVGNEQYSDKDLLKKFSLGKKAVFRFFSKRDRYSKQKLAADLEGLRSFYQDQGFLDFDVTSTQVSISSNKQEIFVTINIKEGGRYTVSEYRIVETGIVPQGELAGLIDVSPGDVFSRKSVADSSRKISDRLADEGYAFANVNAVPEIDEAQQTVAYTFQIDPGPRIYVNRINIFGNATTRDEVIRREMRQFEGAVFSAAKVRRSRIRLQRLGFFDDVNIETPRVPGRTDQVDINVTVVERATGSLLFGLGYSDADGVLLQASISQRNLFGTGRELQINIDNSAVTEVFNIRFVDPYHTIGGISRGINLFSRRIDAEEADTAEYITDTLGAGVFWKIPTTEFNSINLGAGYERVDLESTPATPPEILSFINTNPSNDIFKLTANWARDTRDNFLYPSDGWLNRIALEVATPGLDLEYYRLRYTSTWYQPLVKGYVLRLKGELGYGDGYGDTQELPFFKNFFAGGSSTVRGYDARSLGPRDTGATPEPLGGSQLVLGNIEVLFPVPFVEESKDKRLSLFVDAGQVYGANQDVDLDELRYSAGVAFNWFSPLGPLSISYAEPFNNESTDEIERFQITVGRQFQ